MSELFPTLFSPFEIKGRRFRNRLFLPAHGTGYAEDGRVGERALAYYRARVARGIALLTTEAQQVVPYEGRKYPQLSAADDGCIAALRELARLCAEHDCRFFGQLYHEGRALAHSSDGSRGVALAPSALPDERFHTMPRALTVGMIEDLVLRFAAGARRMREAGCDGVEILVGMGYLHAQFLSPRTNVRSDAYGGSPERRLRFLRETLAAVREATGEDFIVGIRIAGEEFDPDGLDLEVTLDACRRLDRGGLVDYVNVCAGGTHGLVGASNIVPPMFVDTGLVLTYAEAVRRAVSVPVFAAGRINQPHEAERALAAHQADMIGMVRALIADPEFARKAERDRPDDIRACIACNQACIGHRRQGFGVSCIQYPETGRELEYGRLRSAEPRKRVAVVGGGPGGMKAAAVAAERGHEVTLYERAPRLGGQALLAQALPGRAEFGGLVTNLENELRRHGVAVRRNTEATAAMLLADAPDAVIVATGALPYRPPGDFEEAHVVTAWEVIESRANVGGSVLIADWRCDWIGLGLAEKLATEGCAVRLCVNGEMAGETIPAYVRYQWAGRLHRLGVQVMPYLRLFGADRDTVYLQHTVSGDPVLCEDVDTLVLACGHQARLELHEALEGKVPELHAIGDCLSPRTAEEAVLEGLKVAAVI